MNDFAEAGVHPTLIRAPFGTANCDVSYPDGQTANIPQYRYDWERLHGRLKPGFRLLPIGANTHKPSIDQLRVVSKKTSAPPKQQPARLQVPIAPQGVVWRKGKTKPQLSQEKVVSALVQQLSSSQANTSRCIEFPGFFEDCVDGEDQFALWELIRGAPSVESSVEGECYALETSLKPTTGAKKLVIRCRSRTSLSTLRELVSRLRDRG